MGENFERVYAFIQAVSTTLYHYLHQSQGPLLPLYPILHCKKSLFPLSESIIVTNESPSVLGPKKIVTTSCTLFKCSYQTPIHKKNLVTRALSTQQTGYRIRTVWLLQ